MKVILIGLGGASGNILNNIAEDSPNDFNYLYINTDKKSIEDSQIENKLHVDVKENVDINVVVAYGNILTKKLINLPNFLSINIHASLLPRWRGAAPIQRAILSNDKRIL